MSRLHPLAVSLLLATAGPVLAATPQLVLEQDGLDNQALLERDGRDNGSVQIQDGDRNYSLIIQQGDQNHGETQQYGNDNQARVEQVGDRNVTQVYQLNTEGGHSAEVTQLGDANDVRLRQEEAVANGATIYQFGNRQTVEATQYWYANALDTSSEGERNQISVVQTGFGEAVLFQQGQDNRITLEQHPFPYGALADVDQYGRANQAIVSQEGARAYTGEIALEQRGEANLAQLEQNGQGNTIDWLQEGRGNRVEVYQATRVARVEGQSSGDRNTAVVSQNFDFIEARVEQDGIDNLADLTQHTFDSQAAVEQVGVANEVLLRQTDASGAFGPRSANVYQQGTGNVGQITQE